MSFWIIISALALAVAALLGLALARGRAGAEPAAAYDLRVYREQLRDVDRDVERGVIAASDAERIRAEVSRRILAADAELRAEAAGAGQPRALTLGMGLALGIALLAGSLALYNALGAPGYGDLSLERRIELAAEARASRPGQAEAEASLPPTPPASGLSEEYLALLAKLREAVAKRPDDLQGQLLLARNEAASGNFAAAAAAQAAVLRLKGDAAAPQDHADLGELLILAAGGYVSPEAEAELRAALAGDPANGRARYYWGLLEAQTGRPDKAFRIWEALLQEGPSDAPWLGPIRVQIEEMAMRAGVEFALAPEAGPGPSAADIEAAGEMSAEDRAQMIETMVERLSDRLASEGGPPEDWARLIGALGVLGQTERAGAILQNARQVFAGNDAALAMIRSAAEQAGVAE